MKNRLLIVTDELKYNKYYYEYLLREYKKVIKEIDGVVFMQKNDKELFLVLQEEIKHSSNLLIVTSALSYKIVSKIVSTITEGNLIYENSSLMSSNTISYCDNSYLLEYNNQNINIIKITPPLKLPTILLESNQDTLFLTVLENDQESLDRLLSKIAKSFDIKISTSKIIEGLIKIKIVSSRYGDIDEFVKSINRLFEKKVIPHHNIIEYAVEKLKEKNLTITTAESCTGGLISSLITKVSGSSLIYEGSLVTYSNEMKTYMLGVKEESLERYGAVSKEVVTQMSNGALNVLKSDFAIAISGVAGPSGGTQEKPVGTVYIAVCDKNSTVTKKLNLKGDREYIQIQSALWCFKTLIESNKEIFL